MALDKELTQFEALSKSIQNVSSKMDLILFGAEKTDQELLGDVISLQCFHIAVFKEPSAIFEKYIERIKNAPAPTKEEKRKKKQTGSYFTPPYIAHYITKSTIGPLVDKFQKGRKPSRPKTKIRKLLNLRICDPAVGGGIFLVCAHDFMMEKVLEIDPNCDLEKMSRQTVQCLYGVDINPDAIEGTKLALNLNIAKWSLKKKIEEFANTAIANSF